MKVKFLLSTFSIAALGAGAYLAQSHFGVKEEGYTPRSEYIGVVDGSIPAGEYFENIRKNPATGVFNPEDMANAAKQVNSKSTRRSSIGLNWNEAGPDNIGGRTRAILIDKDNSDRVYAGSVSGGLFISDNAGGTWTPYNDQMENLAVSAIAQSSNGDIYVATGCTFDANGGISIPGGGIMKSTDGGVTFDWLASTVPGSQANHQDDWSYVNRIKVDPNNPLHVYAGTGDGLMASTDGGQTWTSKSNFTCGVPSGRVDDVEFSTTGRLFAVMGGSLIYSDNPSGDVCNDYEVVPTTAGWSGSQRADLTVCPADPNKVYALQVSGGQLKAILESNDAGENWAGISPGFPTLALDSTVALFGRDGFSQGFYDMAIEVYPNDCEKILVGGVQFYRANPNWERVSSGFTTGDFYVHSDIHYFTFDPKDDSKLYIGSDGGVGKSLNAKDDVMRFIESNKGYNVTQFYSVAFSQEGVIIAGSQDNGTNLMDPSQPGTGMVATEILGGDGFDCEISDIGELAITSLYFNDVYRQKRNSAPESIVLGNGFKGRNNAPFNSVIRHWESLNDPTSKDSISFVNDTVSTAIGIGDDVTRIFSGNLNIVQPDGEIGYASLFFEDPSKSQVVVNDNSVLRNSTNDSIGFFRESDNYYEFKFDVAPSLQSQITINYPVDFVAGDVLYLESGTQNYPITYTLTNDLPVNDSLKIIDPVQSFTLSVTNDQVLFTRDVLHEDRQVSWIQLNDANFGGISGVPTCIDYSKDGNHVYVGTSSGAVYRYSGINDLYAPILDTDVDQVVTRSTIFTQSSRDVTGICAHPNDPEKLLVTLGNYQAGTHVYEVTNAQTATGLPTANRRDITGNLIDMPVYDAEYEINDDKIVLLATEYGIWSTKDVDASNVEWFSENADLANVQILDIRQQRKRWNEAQNHSNIYAGTYGRGVWVTGDLVSVEDNDPSFISKSDALFTGMKVFPNPVSSTAMLEFEMSESKDVEIRIFDLTGKVVRTFSNNFPEGTAQFQFDVSSLSGGTYFVTLSSGDAYNMSKFVVVK